MLWIKAQSVWKQNKTRILVNFYTTLLCTESKLYFGIRITDSKLLLLELYPYINPCKKYAQKINTCKAYTTRIWCSCPKVMIQCLKRVLIFSFNATNCSPFNFWISASKLETLNETKLMGHWTTKLIVVVFLDEHHTKFYQTLFCMVGCTLRRNIIWNVFH